jgi:hypothetical protein
MSNHFQPKLTELYKLDKWIISNIEMSIKIKEDLFEAYNGALEIVARNVYNNYLSKNEFEKATYINAGDIVYKNLKFIFDFVIWDPNVAKGSSKSFVLDINKALGFPEPKEQVYFTNNQIMMKLQALNLINIVNNTFLNNPIGRATVINDSPEITQNSAWVNAAENLKNAGFTEEWLSKTQIQNKWLDVPKELIDTAREKAVQNGYKKLAVYTTEKDGIITAKLQGYLQNQYPVDLTQSITGTDIKSIKVQLLNIFNK